MNIAEAKILHGVYFRDEIVEREGAYQPQLLKWWAGSSLREAKAIPAHYRDKAHAEPVADVHKEMHKPLSYLAAQGYLKYDEKNGHFHIAVTAKGADIARELDCHFGWIHFIYRQYRDCFLWVVGTALIATWVSILTVKFLH
jgi:hypothetical protein